MADPDTVRTYEWRASSRSSGTSRRSRRRPAGSTSGAGSADSCATAGAVGLQIFGHDEGYPADRMREAGIPSLDADSPRRRATPRPTASTWSPRSRCSSTSPTRCRCSHDRQPSCARAGLLFVTTGNAAPAPRTTRPLELRGPRRARVVLRAADARGRLPRRGSRPGAARLRAWFPDIIRYKVAEVPPAEAALAARARPAVVRDRPARRPAVRGERAAGGACRVGRARPHETSRILRELRSRSR